MSEPTIICPACKSEIKLTESLAAPLIESTKKQYQEQLEKKDLEIAGREEAIRQKENNLKEAQRHMDEQVLDKVQEQLKKNVLQLFKKKLKKQSLH